MNSTGKQIIEAIVRRLKDEDIRTYDCNIIAKFETLDRYEMSQLLTFGDLDKWISDRNKKTNNYD